MQSKPQFTALTVPGVGVRFSIPPALTGSFPLSRPVKTRQLGIPYADIGRRNFLVRCCRGISAAFLPQAFRRFDFPFFAQTDASNTLSSEPRFHLNPHYRNQLTLEATLLKARAGSDEFVSEKYADQIGEILSRWSAGLLRVPYDLKAVEESLASNFLGDSLSPVTSRVVRPVVPVGSQRVTFSGNGSLRTKPFVRELRSYFSAFSQLLTADFQVTRIDLEPAGMTPTRVLTQVHYELVGTGPGYHREQRIGDWELEWEADSTLGFRLQRWKAADEARSVAVHPVFTDVTRAALGGTPSYGSQLLHGTDYWRTVLDGASGIDIYGHNGVSVGDIDGDGFDDLYVCQPGGLPNRLYRNRGDGTFEDITEKSGTGVLDNTACALIIDIDNDGRQDLIVVRANGPLLFLNEGGGKFRQKPDAFQFATPLQGTCTGAAAADYDCDGWLDIYFCQYVYYQGADQYKYPT